MGVSPLSAPIRIAVFATDAGYAAGVRFEAGEAGVEVDVFDSLSAVRMLDGHRRYALVILQAERALLPGYDLAALAVLFPGIPMAHVTDVREVRSLLANLRPFEAAS